MINLDTHILIHALNGSLRKQEHLLLTQHDWCISGIVLWELAKLHQLGRLSTSLDHPGFRNAMNFIQVIPIDDAIAKQSCELDFSGDPADELIAATSICHDIPLLTRDKRITSSRLVPLA